MKNLLVKGNPAFVEGGNVVVFNPNSRQFYVFPNEEINNPETLKRIPDIEVVNKKENDMAELMLVISRDCNLRCTYCFAYGGHIKTKMTKEVAIAAIHHVLDNTNYKKIKLTFSGGECTTNPEVIKACVSEVERLGIEGMYIVATNGVINEQFLDYLIEKDFIFSISNDGIPENHDKLRPFADGSGTSKRIEKTIKKLVAAGKYFRTRSTITRDTVSSMPDCVNYFADLGVKYIDFELLDKWGKAADRDMDMVAPDDFISYFEKAMDVAALRGVSVGTAALINLMSPSFQMCPGIIGKQFMVLPDGQITRCNDVMDETHFLADLFLVGKYDEDKKDFVISRPDIVEELDQMTVDKNSKCDNCYIKYICSGACIARHLWQTNSKDITSLSEYQCEMNKAIIDLILRRLWNATNAQ